MTNSTKRISGAATAHARRLHKTSEFLGAVFLLTALTLTRALPWRILSETPSSAAAAALMNLAGALLLACGIATIRAVHAELGRFHQPRAPGEPTTELVRTGPFRASRNPTYAAAVMLIAPGMGLLSRNPWVFVLLPATALAFYVVLIREEETYLKDTFPGKWEGYCASTPRWI